MRKTRENPFAYPEGMSWLPYMAHSAPGSMIWSPLKNAETGDEAFAFIMRESSDLISSLPTLPLGGVPIEWRFGMLGIDVPGGKRVAMIIGMARTPGGISEITINALHLDDHAIALLDEPFVMLFVGDSGSVERMLLFPRGDALADALKLGRQIFDKHPWTDPDFDQAKVIYEQTTDLQSMWEQMGKR